MVTFGEKKSFRPELPTSCASAKEKTGKVYRPSSPVLTFMLRMQSNFEIIHFNGEIDGDVYVMKCSK